MTCCFAALMPFLIFSGCGKNKEKTASAPRSSNQYTLIYSADAHGSIDGAHTQTVKRGESGSSVRAVPAEGYHFVGWSDGVTTPRRTDSEVTSDLAVDAAFAINQYTLLYTPTEGGSIEGARRQTVQHGSDGSTVTAVAAEHYHFAGWSDGDASPQRTDRNIKADQDLKAHFAIDQYTLTYAARENGSLKGARSQIVDYGGEGKEVTAVPAEGYHFVSWSDGVTTVSRTDRKVTSDRTVSATFAINQYTLTYKAAAHGSIAGASPQTVTFGGDGSPVTAVPAEHYHFAGWSDGLQIASRTDRKVKGDQTVTAAFAIDQYALTYHAGENGAIKGKESQRIDYGSNGSEVTAMPSVGYHFVTWSDGVTSVSRMDRKVTKDLAVTANFAINQYTLTYTAGKNGTIDGISPQIVNYGGNASAVTAVAAKGYHFVNWSDGVDTAKRIDAKVTDNFKVDAVFAVNTYSIGGHVSGLVQGTQLVLQNNGSDNLTISANGDFLFATELLKGNPFAVSVLTQPRSPNQTCTVSGGSGTVPEEDVKNIEVTCVLNTYTIGGTLSGLPAGDRVVLQNNKSDNLVVGANGAFTFAKALDDGSKYKVTILNLPERPNWTCDLRNPEGNLAGNNVTDVVVDCYPKVVLQAAAGIRKVNLEWNSHDFSKKDVTFNLCGALEGISAGGFGSCMDFKGAFTKAKISSPLVVAQLTNDIPYWFQVEANYASGRRTLSNVVKAIPFGGLNDTGIDWCSDDTINHNTEGVRVEKTEGCKNLAASHPGQDAVYGRDAQYRGRKLSKTGAGAAGLDFTKVCMSGEIAGEGDCPPNPTLGSGANNWACTHDNVTGLTWEVKTTSGLHSRANTYTWHNPQSSDNGGKSGFENGGTCEESGCDTLAFVAAVNATGLCGVTDWRVPTKMELLSIVDNGRFNPSIDLRFFPNIFPTHYWSWSPYAEKEDYAWEVNFKYGDADTEKKNDSNHVLLVHGKTVTFGLHNPDGIVKEETKGEGGDKKGETAEGQAANNGKTNDGD